MTSCPKCFALTSDDVTECPNCGVTEAQLMVEAGAARLHQAPSSKASIFRWKRESVELLVMILIAWALVVVIRWGLWEVFVR
jgi:uncharacterized membrane protein YvbJ